MGKSIKHPPLSKRLRMDADFVAEGALLADVGCDHAYCSIYLAAFGKIRHGIAMDVRKGPLARAQANICFYGVENVVETRLSDGLRGLKQGEADCILIGGMGGALMQEILEQGEAHVRSCKSLVLQPQSEIASVRRYLHRRGMWITAEEMCHEEGKYYTAIRAEWAPDSADLDSEIPEICLGGLEGVTKAQAEHFGPCLIRSRHPVLQEYLRKEFRQKEALLQNLEGQASERSRERREFISREKEEIHDLMKIIG